MKQKLLLMLFLVFTVAFSALAQDKTVKGRITDPENGEGLPGVNVLIKGTSTGTITDVNGNYTLSVPQGATLVFRAVGFVTQEIVVGEQTTINPSMSVDTKGLDEVVVTGYRDESRIKSVSSVSTISSGSIEQVPVSTFDQILQGQAPGLLIQAGSGRPGAAASVVIRGINSINASTDPLYVVDGIQINAGDFATLNPNDFDKVSVLKDAAATSIYGSRGANGVIVITTKRGKAGKTQFNYRFLYGRSFKPQFRGFRPLTTNEVIDLEQEFGLGYTVGLPSERIEEFRNIETDWFDAFVRDANTWSHEVNASGGSESLRYYVSGNFFGQEGTAIRSGLDRYTLRVNLDGGAPNDNFRFGTSLSLGYSQSTNTNGEGGAFGSNPFFGGIRQKPYIPIYDENGLNGYYGPVNADGTPNPDALITFNPIEFRDQSTESDDELKLIGSIYAEYDIPKIEGLTIRTQWGADYRSRTFFNLRNPNSISGRTSPGANPATGTGGILTQSWNRRIRFNGNTSINYTRSIGEDHEISATIFNEIFYQNFSNFQLTGYGLGRITDIANGINEQANPPALSGGETANSLISYFADFTYTFKGKYSAKVGARRDGSSRFGRNNRFANFFSVGANWILSEESFMKNVSFIDLLKLRVSYGTAGNQEVGDFDDLEVYGAGVYNGQPTLVPGIGNPDLRWETNNQFNIGIEYGLFESRITGSIEYYNNLTTDLFLDAQLSRTTGFSSLDLNVGEMRNSGIEIQVNANLLNTNGFRWDISGNYSYNDNKIEKLYNGQELELGTFILREGEPFGSHYFVERVGVDPSTGQYLWYDLNGNVTNVFNENNRTTNHGIAYAPHYGGITNTLSYKGVTISALFTYAAGNTRLDNDRFFLEDPGRLGTANVSDAVLDIWRQPGDITGIAAFGQARRFDSGFIQDASFLRLRNVTMSYQLPTAAVQKAGLRSARVYVQGQNVFTFTNWSGLDPEDSSNVGLGNYPALRQWTIGADIGF